MNGEPLSDRHGFPLRLIVPGWYGVASVKWLGEIELIASAFAGYFQTDKYVYEWERNGRAVREQVTVTRVRALITEPGPEQEIQPGNLPIRGLAWSGAAPIARVEVRVGGDPWQEARLLGKQHRYGWRRWELNARVSRQEVTTIQARATDLAGHSQPQQPEWNRLGYGANAVQEVQIRVR